MFFFFTWRSGLSHTLSWVPPEVASRIPQGVPFEIPLAYPTGSFRIIFWSSSKKFSRRSFLDRSIGSFEIAQHILHSTIPSWRNGDKDFFIDSFIALVCYFPDFSSNSFYFFYWSSDALPEFSSQFYSNIKRTRRGFWDGDGLRPLFPLERGAPKQMLLRGTSTPHRAVCFKKRSRSATRRLLGQLVRKK